MKYSEKELREAVEILANVLVRDPGTVTCAIDLKNNKVIVFTDDPSVKKVVIQNVDEDMVSFAPKMTVQDQASWASQTSE